MITGLAALAALAIAPAAASAAPSPINDQDFAAGTTGTATWVVEPGALRLRPFVSANFDGSSLPPDAETAPWNPGGTATVANGALTVDGARVNTIATFPPPATLEFRATFADAPSQHVGFGEDFNAGPWAMFSTAGGEGKLFVRTRTGTEATSVDTEVTGVSQLFGTPHDFRIEWTAADVRFFIDGIEIEPALPAAVPGPMRPVASDFQTATTNPAPGAGAAVLKVDWFGMSPYPASGTFESRLLEADDQRAVWQKLTVTGSADVTFETRTGDSAAAMSAYQPLGTGGAIQSPAGKFIQYRATFTNAEQRVTQVSAAYEIDSAAPATTIGSSSVSGTTATVTFSSTATDVARFECSRDGGAFAACTSPATFPGLSPGSHTVSVRAVDKVGNVGAAVSATVTVASGTGGSGTGGPGTPGSGGSTPDRKAPKVVVVGSRTLRVGARVPLRLKCPADEASCDVTVRLKRGHKNASERKTATIAGGATKKVKLRLTDKTRALLIARGRLTVQAVIIAEDAAGNDRRTTFALTLRPR